MTERILIRNGWIVSMDPEIGDIKNGSILIEGSRILQIGIDIEEPDGCEVIDATGMIVTPGLVDTHKHLWQTGLRGVVADGTLLGYFTDVRQRYLSRYRPEDVWIGNYAGALELIGGGTTTVLDHSHGVVTPDHSDALAEATIASGIRGVWAYGFCPVEADGSPAFDSHADRVSDAYRVRDTWFADGNELLRMGIAATEQNLLPYENTRAEIGTALDMDTVWTSHTQCGPGNSPISRDFYKLVADGLVDYRAVLSHCNEFNVGDFDTIRQLGAHFASSPDSEIALGIAQPTPYVKALLAGVQPSLGTDCVTCMSSDMWTTMRLSLTVARGQFNAGPGVTHQAVTEQAVLCRDVFRWATIEGARALGLEEEVGSLRPGKAADVLLINARALNLAPVLDPVNDLVLHAHAGNVDTVLINGVVRQRGGVLLGVDLDATLDRLEDSMQYLTAPDRSAAPTTGDEIADEVSAWTARLRKTTGSEEPVSI